MKLIILALLILGPLPLSRMGATPLPQSSDTRPDIILVLVDDMTGADWRSLRKTKDRLPSVFPNYINTDPTCCPSRASILRGQYPHSNGTLSNSGPSGGRESFRDQEDATIAVELRNAGYHTGLIGKYLNGYAADGGVPPGWDFWFAQVHPDGSDTVGQYFDWKAVDGNTVRSYGSGASAYSTDVIQRKAVGFVASAPADQPLFAYVAPVAPHEPADVAPRHWGTCAGVRLGSRRKPSFNEPDMADKPDYMKHAKLDPAELTAFDRKRQCSLKAVDELVVALVDALEARGRPYDLVFASDNGYMLGEHRRMRKGVPYEESIRTTMRARGPNFPAGEDPRLVSNIDLAPTFAAIAGARPRDDWDGRSLLAGSQPRLDRQLIGLEWYRQDAGDGDEIAASHVGGRLEGTPPFRGFRSKDGIVYVEYATGEIELYDLRDDAYQLKNMAKGKATTDFPAHHARVEALRNCRAEACWVAEDGPLGSGITP